MHVTTAEAALASVLIGWLASRATQRATQRRDHLTRLWERRAAAYEAALLFAHDRNSYRYNLMQRIDADMRLKEKRDELWPVAKQDEIYVRLYIYGSLEVRDAYVKWFRADLSWKKAYAEIEAKDPDADFARKKAYAEIVPEFLNDTTPYSRSQMRERAKKADEATDEAMADLENTIVQAIQREPRSIRTSRRLLGWHASRHDPASR